MVITSKVVMRIKCKNACKILWSEHSKDELEASYCCLEPCHSKCGPHTGNLCITWELIRNAESQTPTESCIFSKISWWLGCPLQLEKH